MHIPEILLQKKGVPCAPRFGDPLYHMLESPTFLLFEFLESVKKKFVTKMGVFVVTPSHPLVSYPKKGTFAPVGGIVGC